MTKEQGYLDTSIALLLRGCANKTHVWMITLGIKREGDCDLAGTLDTVHWAKTLARARLRPWQVGFVSNDVCGLLSGLDQSRILLL